MPRFLSLVVFTCAFSAVLFGCSPQRGAGMTDREYLLANFPWKDAEILGDIETVHTEHGLVYIGVFRSSGRLYTFHTQVFRNAGGLFCHKAGCVWLPNGWVRSAEQHRKIAVELEFRLDIAARQETATNAGSALDGSHQPIYPEFGGRCLESLLIELSDLRPDQAKEVRQLAKDWSRTPYRGASDKKIVDRICERVAAMSAAVGREDAR